MIGDRMSIKPKLDCHFISDEGQDPETWWKMDFDKEYIVKGVKIFVIQNGNLLSGLEDATVFVGD